MLEWITDLLALSGPPFRHGGSESTLRCEMCGKRDEADHSGSGPLEDGFQLPPSVLLQLWLLRE